MDAEENGAFILWDSSEFGKVNGTKGKKLILPPREAQAIRQRQRRYRQPRPPPIQLMLGQAHYLKAHRLDRTPGLTRAQLAREIGVTPSYLTRILNLLNLAPEIQKYIDELPPSKIKGAITESRLKRIGRMEDHQVQIEEFEKLRVNSGLQGGT